MTTEFHQVSRLELAPFYFFNVTINHVQEVAFVSQHCKNTQNMLLLCHTFQHQVSESITLFKQGKAREFGCVAVTSNQDILCLFKCHGFR